MVRSGWFSRVSQTWLPVAFVALAGPAAAQCVVNENEFLFAGDGAPGDELGFAVDVDPSVQTVVAGAFGQDDQGTQCGAAYVYNEVGGLWSETTTLLPADVTDFDEFGKSVAISGTRIAVGAPKHTDTTFETGAVFVYEFDGSDWNLDQKLFPADGTGGEHFGRSVGLDGNTLVVGSPNDDEQGNRAGAAYVYRKGTAGWTLDQKLLASDGGSTDLFGDAVAIDGNQIVVGAFSNGNGAAYVFVDTGVGWFEDVILTSSSGSDADQFATSVAIEGNVVLCGDPQDDSSGAPVGTVHVFRESGGFWSLDDVLNPSDGATSDRFGESCSISGNLAVVGAPNHAPDGGIRRGACYAYRFSGSVWVEEAQLQDSQHSVRGGELGQSVVVEGDLCIAGDNGGDGLASNTGAFLEFTIPDLVLEASLTTVLPGDTLTLTTCGGKPSTPAFLYAVEINGGVTFLKVTKGLFDGLGQFSFGGAVPPGLSGLAVTFQTLGVFEAGKAGLSNKETVTFD